MALTTRMLPLNGSGGTVTGWAGPPEPNQGGLAGRRYYSASGGQTIDAQGDPMSGDAAMLTSQNFLVVCASGSTASRPTTLGWLKPGMLFIDTSLNLVLCWDGLSWRNVLTGATA